MKPPLAANVFISVAMATKDGMPHVKEAIEGLRRQTHQNIELIIQDAVSTDGTLEYLQSLDLPFPISIISEPDESLVDGYARAWARCSGDLTVSGACDEVFDDDALAQYAAWSLEHPKAVFVYGGSRLIDSEGAVVSEFKPHQFDLLDYIRHEMCPTAAGAFNRRLLGAEYYLDSSLDSVPDFELVTRMALRFGEESIVGKTKVTMSARADNTSQSYSPEFFGRFAKTKTIILERLLSGSLQAEFTAYLRGDFIGRMQVSMAKLIESIEGPSQYFDEAVLAAAASGHRTNDVKRLTRASRNLYWDNLEAAVVRRDAPLPDQPNMTDPAWPMPLSALQITYPGGEIEHEPAGATLTFPPQAREFAAMLKFEPLPLDLHRTPAWLRIRFETIAGEPVVLLFDTVRHLPEARRTPLEQGAGELILDLVDPDQDSLVIVSRTADGPTAVRLRSVELISSGLIGLTPSRGWAPLQPEAFNDHAPSELERPPPSSSEEPSQPRIEAEPPTPIVEGAERAPEFRWREYWKMFQARGLRLPLTYFLDAHLFDLRHGTDTHHWLPKDSYGETATSIEHSQYYMCSWTKEVRAAFRHLHQLLGSSLGDYNLVDIGCGKGKVCFLWSVLSNGSHFSPQVFGVDHSAYLIDIAKSNSLQFSRLPEIEFICADATALDYSRFGPKVIFYLYNPFDAQVVQEFIGRVRQIDHLVIYCHPAEKQCFIDNGYEVLWEKSGVHLRDTLTLLRLKA